MIKPDPSTFILAIKFDSESIRGKITRSVFSLLAELPSAGFLAHKHLKLIDMFFNHLQRSRS